MPTPAIYLDTRKPYYQVRLKANDALWNGSQFRPNGRVMLFKGKQAARLYLERLSFFPYGAGEVVIEEVVLPLKGN